MKKIKLPSTAYNLISAAGAVLSVGALLVFLFLMIITLTTGESSSYLGLFMFIIIPPFLVIGLLLIPIGMWITHKRVLAGKVEEKKLPVFDFNKQTHRNAAMIFLFGTTIFVLLTAVGSYEAFHFTESNQFCGTVCHEVMHPEYTAYNKSPHARVKCVECHVGEGVDWYVKSKLSGLRQVYGVLTDDFSRPIKTPIDNLRPARETCEKCHWPEKFYARTDKLEKHYLSDENNSPWNIYLTLKIGGEHSSQGYNEGIHWHVNESNIVQYVSLDDKRQEIPWVRFINKEKNDTTIYIDENYDFDVSMLDTLEIRTMDCIDCHNRPSHNYLPFDRFINNGFAEGKISTKIPEFKGKLTELLQDQEFSSIDSVKSYLESELISFYEEDYPEFYSENEQLIKNSIDGFMEKYSSNVFPIMKVDWRKYPSNIGHLNYKGCFRCHNDNHVSESEKYLKRDCDQCHEINAQGTPDNLVKATFGESLEFKHPIDIGEAWKEMNCSDCHNGLTE